MKKWFLLSLIALTTLNLKSATGCEGYMLMEKGVTLVYKDYDGKEKFLGSQTSTITDITDVSGVLTVKIHSIFKDDKDKVTNEGDVSFSCANGEIKIDMKSMLDQKMMEGFKDMEVVIDQSNLIYPATFTEGQTLPDGQMTATISSGGMQIMKMVMDVVERKVEKFETITTPAGEFACVKTSEVTKNTMMGRTSQFKSINWISKNIGPVRTESYNEQGALQSVHVLAQVIR